MTFSSHHFFHRQAPINLNWEMEVPSL